MSTGIAAGESAPLSPYEQLLGPSFAELHPHVREAHTAPLTATGSMHVIHGDFRLVPLLIKLMKLPKAGPDKPVHLVLTQKGPCMFWKRQIGSTMLSTRQIAKEGLLVEQSGPGGVAFHLKPEGGTLTYCQDRASFSGVTMPKWFAPRVEGRVSPEDTGWRTEVTVSWRGKLVCRYAGCMRAT